jgi:hypothetical protein
LFHINIPGHNQFRQAIRLYSILPENRGENFYRPTKGEEGGLKQLF